MTSSAGDVDSPLRTLPARHAIRVDEYFKMGEHGVLAPDARCELLEGEIFDMPPIGPMHAGTTNRLAEILSAATRNVAITSVQSPVLLGDLSAPEPDIALLRPRDDFYTTAHPGPTDVLLLVEVADTSLNHDRESKLPLYARFEIPEIWIIDTAGKHLDIHRHPDGARYTQQFRAGDLKAVDLSRIPGVVLNLSSLF
jgi:Uma2 family endonuclease